MNSPSPIVVMETGLRYGAVGNIIDLKDGFVLTTLGVGNVGPAFGQLGPTANYGFLPAALKWWYCVAMLAGRLEIYTLLIMIARVCHVPKTRAAA